MTPKKKIFKKHKPVKEYRYNQDRKFNTYQEAHIKGDIDVHAVIPELGMSLAQHWRDDWKRRLNVKSSRNR